MSFNLATRIYSHKEKLCFRLYNAVIPFYKRYKISIDASSNLVLDGVYTTGDNAHLQKGYQSKILSILAQIHLNTGSRQSFGNRKEA